MNTLNSDLKLRNFEVTSEGVCRQMGQPSSNLDRFPVYKPYRLYRFLSDLDELVALTSDDLERIRIAAILTRRFLNDATWVRERCPEVTLEHRSATVPLYQEPDYPFAINVFSWLPQKSPIHCHGTWSIVAFLGNSTFGREQNYFWHRKDDGSKPGYAVIKPYSKEILEPGDIIGFTSDAIHNIMSISAENEENPDNPKPTLTFNIFGKQNKDRRFSFNPFENTVEHY